MEARKLAKGQRVKIVRAKRADLVGQEGVLKRVSWSADRRTGAVEIKMDHTGDVVFGTPGDVEQVEDRTTVGLEHLIRRHSHNGSQMDREWILWRQVCKHLGELGVDVNSKRATPFVMAVRLWGEENAALRMLQPDQRDGALDDARKAYEPHVIDPDGDL